MKSHLYYPLVIIGLLFAGTSQVTYADTELEVRFQEAFVTAGYSAAAGAAVGAALLTFQNEPIKHLKFISIGASVGFLGGTALGSWLAIAPAFAENSKPMPEKFEVVSNPRSKFVLRPWFTSSENKFVGLEAGAVFALNF